MASLKKSFEDFEYSLYTSGLRIKPRVFIVMMCMAAIIVTVLMLAIGLHPIVAILGFAGTISLIFGLPMNMRKKRIDELEDNIPDALKYMSTSLKAGSTIENSLKEVSTAEYGPYSEEMATVLRQIREGRSFEDSLKDTAQKSNSQLFQRVSAIIIDARKAGAGLAQVLEAISEDARDVLRIKRERVTRTVMQVVFINAASVVIAPVIFGMVLTLVGYISTGIAKSGSMGGMASGRTLDLDALNLLFSVYIMVAAGFAAVSTGIMQYGDAKHNLTRLPLLALVAIIIYEAGKFFGALLMGGGF